MAKDSASSRSATSVGSAAIGASGSGDADASRSDPGASTGLTAASTGPLAGRGDRHGEASARRSGSRSPSSSTSRSSSASRSASSSGSSASAPPKWLGKRIGRFRLVGMIGKGSMGRVFRAEDVQLHRLVALKVISSRSSRRRSAAQKFDQFMREGRSAARLEHPNIVGVYEVNSTADVHYIAMELVEGGNLKDLVKAAGPLAVARACLLAADAADALQHAHEQGVVHRDVKPANLMLTRGGRCKLGDFGLACPTDESGRGRDGLGSGVGTPQYVSPEVVLGDEATALSDLYSLGASLYFLLTGQPPFPGDSVKDVLRRHVDDAPPDVRTIRPDVPEALALAIWRAMAKQPTARWESAGHFARALRLHTIGAPADPAADDLPAAGQVPSPPAGLALDRRHALVGLLGGGAFVAVTAMIVTIVSRGGDGGARSPARPDAAPAAMATVDLIQPVDVPLPEPGRAIPATDAPALLRVAREPDPARHPGLVTVEGWVSRIELPADDGAGRPMLRFRGVDRARGVTCPLTPDVLAALRSRAGGDPVVKLRDRRVRVTGRVELSDGQPWVTPESADQIVVGD